MKAIEIFDSFQGEGKFQGMLLTFIRFKVCKRQFGKELCPWCDTEFKMKTSMNFSFTCEDLEPLMKNTHYRICFTGGEPTLYNKDILEIVKHFRNKLSVISLETNGCRLETFLNEFHANYPEFVNTDNLNINYSPKFFTPEEVDQYIDFISGIRDIYKPVISLKIVVSDKNKDLVRRFLNGITTKTDSYWLQNLYLMPMGTNPSTISKNMPVAMNFALEYNCNVSGRLHISHSFV